MRPRPLSFASLLVASTVLPAACGNSCFGGSTWISLARGRRRLRDIRVGDEVQSFDVRSGRLEVRPVTHVFRHGPKTVGQLMARSGAGPRGVTSNHPIFIETTGAFAPASEMTHDHPSRKGLYWDDQDLRTIELEAFRAGPEKHKLEVYNLSIAETETYFADGLLVHNKSFPCQSADCEGTGAGGRGTGGNAATGGTFQVGGAGVGGLGGQAPAATGGIVGEAGAAGSAGEGGGVP